MTTQDADALDEPTPEPLRLPTGLRTHCARHVVRRRASGIPVERAPSQVRCLVRESQSAER